MTVLNKYGIEGKRNDLGLPPAIFAQAFQRTSKNKIIKMYVLTYAH
jgi:hypothetical protein